MTVTIQYEPHHDNDDNDTSFYEQQLSPSSQHHHQVLPPPPASPGGSSARSPRSVSGMSAMEADDRTDDVYQALFEAANNYNSGSNNISSTGSLSNSPFNRMYDSNNQDSIMMLSPTSPASQRSHTSPPTANQDHDQNDYYLPRTTQQVSSPRNVSHSNGHNSRRRSPQPYHEEGEIRDNCCDHCDDHLGYSEDYGNNGSNNSSAYIGRANQAVASRRQKEITLTCKKIDPATGEQIESETVAYASATNDDGHPSSTPPFGGGNHNSPTGADVLNEIVNIDHTCQDDPLPETHECLEDRPCPSSETEHILSVESVEPGPGVGGFPGSAPLVTAETTTILSSVRCAREAERNKSSQPNEGTGQV